METLTRRLTQLTFGIATLALMMTVATPTLARGKATLKVQAVAAHGRVLTVSVVNPGARPLRGTLVARVLTRAGIVTAVASVDIGAGQTSDVRVDLPETALDVPPLGVVVDDGVPF